MLTSRTEDRGVVRGILLMEMGRDKNQCKNSGRIYIT
jgi:hypothetical protein